MQLYYNGYKAALNQFLRFFTGSVCIFVSECKIITVIVRVGIIIKIKKHKLRKKRKLYKSRNNAVIKLIFIYSVVQRQY